MSSDERTRGAYSAEAVRTYYDRFTEAHREHYLQRGNLRIERAIERILPFVTSDMTVLEIGCGIGLVAERIARVAKRGAVWACDISETSIRHARQRVQEANACFCVVDVLTDFEKLNSWVPTPVDLIVMVDVVEHCPLAKHPTLFQNLRGALSNGGQLILTFPSPQYQRYLRATNPKGLQIIDEEVELTHILSLAEATGFALKHFSLEDVWLQNQYVHCVLGTSNAIRPLEDHRLALTMQELASLISPAASFILVDEQQWSGEEVLRLRRPLPFLERDGQYWGPPADDAAAVSELARLRQTGAEFMVFGFPAFWWLDYYSGLTRHLRSNFRCVLENERLVVFDLRR